MGAVFVFRLESVLALKRRRERQLQEDLAIAIQQEQAARQRLGDLEEQRATGLAALESVQRAELLDLPALLQVEAYLDQAARAIASQMQQVAAASLVVTNVQERHAAAATETKAIERLRERKLDEFRRGLDRLEEQRLGELALQQHVQRMGDVA